MSDDTLIRRIMGRQGILGRMGAGMRGEVYRQQDCSGCFAKGVAVGEVLTTLSDIIPGLIETGSIPENVNGYISKIEEWLVGCVDTIVQDQVRGYLSQYRSAILMKDRFGAQAAIDGIDRVLGAYALTG